MSLAFLAGHWYRVSPLTRLLTPVSWLFAAITTLRRMLYRLRLLRAERIGLPVIVIGNLVAGGSGKTPLALWVAEYLRVHGLRPGIVCRGYGGRIAAQGEAPCEVNIASDPALVGDEPLLLARRAGCPVWVGRDRVAACRALRIVHPECNVLVLDDGLQHYRLARDVEIVVVDERGFGNGLLLPAGPLREPVSRLASVDAVVSHGCAAVRGWAMRLVGCELVRLIDTSRAVPIAALGARRVHAVAGTGHPQRFFAQLEALGLEIVPHAFPDHHAFVASELAFGDGAPVVMTEKDAVKCRRFARSHWWMLPVHAELDPAFGEFLMDKLREKGHGSKTA